MTNEQELIKHCIEAKEKSVRFFSGENKQERELWVVKEFLTSLGVDFSEGELKAQDDDPPDVIFRQANFEIKEVLDEERRRHQEYKNDLKKARSAERVSELFTQSDFRKGTLQELVDRINGQIQTYQVAPAIRAQIDLLFYVNLLDLYKIQDHGYVLPEDWKCWRSVSMIENGQLGLVFWAGKDAPEFLKSKAGKLMIRNA
jgi:hypothetical protein